MRKALLAFLLLLALGLAPASLWAEDDPAEPAADQPTADPAWDGQRFWFASILRPNEAWEKLTTDLRAVPRASRRAEQLKRCEAYVEAFQGAGIEAEPAEALTLHYFLLFASRYAEARDALTRLMAAEEVDVAERDKAAESLARLLVNPKVREGLGEDALAEMAAAVEGYLAARAGDDGAPTRGRLHGMLARHVDDPAETIRHTMLSALEDPSSAAAAGRSLVRTLKGQTHDMEGYGAVRAGCAAALATLRHLAAAHLASVKDGEDGDDERVLRRAEASVRQLETLDTPIAKLGKPAEAWTLEHAFGDVGALEDLKGKVVVLDFWATWCPWCIKSFPAIRDLLRDYAEEGLAVVGVTASASTVYEHRYDLDDDLKHKLVDGERPSAVARLARGEPKPEATPPQLAAEDYRAVEREALARFIENHEMTWPVVLIDKAEPAAKYALAGWPHAVVIDRQGRVRYFKSGALLRDRPEAVAAFRAVLEDLLAEPVPETPSED